MQLNNLWSSCHQTQDSLIDSSFERKSKRHLLKKQLKDKTLPLKQTFLRTFHLVPSMEGRDIKIMNTKYTNHRSGDQSHQNYAIRAEATSLRLP